MTESRILLNPVRGGVRIVALSISSHEQIQLNRVCCFLILLILSTSEGFGVFLQIIYCTCYELISELRHA